jgi:Uma2 family endonuclease
MIMAISTRSGNTHVEDGEPAPWVGQRMTLDEFLGLPEVKPNLEYDNGVVNQKMAAKPVHGTLQTFLASVLNQIAGPKRLGLAMTETRFVTPGWAPVPDVSFYLRRRLRLQDGWIPEDFFEPPDIAIEVVSPSQSVTELIAKSLRYLALGTSIALIVDPAPRTVLGLRPDQAIQVMREDDRIDLDDVLRGFEVTVREMFAAIIAGWSDEPEAAEVADADVTSSS